MDEPNYQITDASGTVIGEIGETNSGGVAIEHASSGETAVLDADGLDVGSVSTTNLNTGRSWTELSNSRSANTTFTNNTDSEIEVAASYQTTASGTFGVNLNIDGNDNISRFQQSLNSGEDFVLQGIVGPGEDYEVNFFNGLSDVNLIDWQEYRP